MSSASVSSSSSRRSRYVRPTARRRLLWAVSAALLAATSLLGKSAYYGAAADARAEQDDERRVQDFLTAHRWELSGSAELVADGGGAVRHFRVPGCTGIVRVGLLPANGEMARLFAQSGGADARVFHIHRGRTFRDPPRFAYLHAKGAGVMEALGFWPRAISSVVSVSQPQECRLEAALPWSEL